ncbi:hypothetical protein [Acidocella aminolytica]
MLYLWRVVDYEGEIFESYVTKTRDFGFHEENPQATP